MIITDKMIPEQRATGQGMFTPKLTGTQSLSTKH